MSGIPGSTASSLANAVPGVDQAQGLVPSVDLGQLQKSVAADAQPSPVPSPDQTQAPQPSLDDLMNQTAQAGQPSLDDLMTQAAGPSDDQVQQEAAGNDETAGFLTRARIGFAADDDKKINLEDKYGKGNVRETKQGFFVKSPDSGKWMKFNNDWFGMGDPANLGKTGAFLAGAIPAEAAVLGASGAEAATGFGAPAAPATFMAGQAAAGAMGAAAEKAAAGLMGLRRNESSTSEQLTNDALDMAKSAGLNATFGMISKGIGDAFTQKQATKAAGQVLDKVIQPLADEASFTAVPELKKAMGAQAAPEANARMGLDRELSLNDKQKALGVDLTAAEANPTDDKLAELAKAASSSPKYKAFVSNRVDQLKTALSNYSDMYKPAGSATDAIDAGSVVDRAYGKLIGGFRKAILKASNEDTQFAAPQISQALQGTAETADKEAVPGLLKTFGFGGDTGMVPPDGDQLEKLSQDLKISIPEVRLVVRHINEAAENITNGQGSLHPEDINKAYTDLAAIAKRYAPNPGEAQSETFKALTGLRNAYRDSFDEGAANVLGEEQRDAYLANKARFGEVKDAGQTVKRLFKADSPSVKNIVQYVKGGGLNNAEQVRAIRTVVEQENPAGWDSVAKAVSDDLLGTNKLDAATKEGQTLLNNWKGIRDGLDKSSEMYQSVLGPKRYQALYDLADVGSQIQANSVDTQASPGNVKKLISAGKALFHADLGGVADAFSANHAFATLMDTKLGQRLINSSSPAEKAYLMKLRSNAAIQGAATVQATHTIHDAVWNPNQSK